MKRGGRCVLGAQNVPSVPLWEWLVVSYDKVFNYHHLRGNCFHILWTYQRSADHVATLAFICTAVPRGL